MQSIPVLIKTNENKYMVKSTNKSLTIDSPMFENTVEISKNCLCYSASLASSGFPIVFHNEEEDKAFITAISQTGQKETKRLMPCANFSKAKECAYFHSNIFGYGCFYTVEEKNTQQLYVEFFSQEDTQQILIDSCQLVCQSNFFVYSKDTPIVIYKNKKAQLICCTIDENKVLNKNILSSTADVVSDITTLFFQNRIHILFSLRTKVSTKVYYRYIENNQLSTANALFEGKTFSNIALFSTQNKIFAFAINDLIGFYSFSDNNGKSFYNQARYFKEIEVASRCTYVSQEKNFIAQEVLLDKNNNILLNDLFTLEKTVEIKAASKNNSTELGKLRDKISRYESEIKEKNEQIMEISKTVSQAQQQSAVYIQQWRRLYEQLKEEFELKEKDLIQLNKDLSLKEEEINRVNIENEELKNKCNSLKENNKALKKAKELVEQELFRVNNEESF